MMNGRHRGAGLGSLHSESVTVNHPYTLVSILDQVAEAKVPLDAQLFIRYTKDDNLKENNAYLEFEWVVAAYSGKHRTGEVPHAACSSA